MLDTLLPALAGATVSVINDTKLSKIKIVRMWSIGFFFSLFLTEDAIKLMLVVYPSEINVHGAAFMLAIVGAPIVEKVLVIVNAFKYGKWYE